jgi:hypothetical protein
MSEQDSQELERRSKQVFDASVAALDAATRSRLTRIRHTALEALAPAPRYGWRSSLLPVGAVAAAALVAWFLVSRAPQIAPSADTGLQVASLSDLEILFAEEDLEMLDEELEFYGWLEEQPEFTDADDTVG